MRKQVLLVALGAVLACGGYAVGQADRLSTEYSIASSDLSNARTSLQNSNDNDLGKNLDNMAAAQDKMSKVYMRATLSSATVQYILSRSVGGENSTEVDILQVAQNQRLIEQNKTLIEQNQRIESLLKRIADKK